MRQRAAVGVDVGGTKVLAVALGPEHQVLDECRVATPKHPTALVEAIASAVDSLDCSVGSLGVGIAGLVTVRGEVVVSPHLADPAELHLPRRLGDRYGVEVCVDNDANAAAWGEAMLGAGRGARDAVVVTLGTGIGSGLICNGALVRGAHGFGGEAGHTTVNFDGDRHVTGMPGVWEHYASGTALRGLAGGVLDDQELFTIEGASILHDYAERVAIGLANLITLLDPEVVVLGGGVSELGEPLRLAIDEHLDAWVFGSNRRPRVRLVLATLGERAGAIGAALLGAGT